MDGWPSNRGSVLGWRKLAGSCARRTYIGWVGQPKRGAQRLRARDAAEDGALLHGNDVHPHFEALLAGREDDAIDRRDIGIVTPDGQRSEERRVGRGRGWSRRA